MYKVRVNRFTECSWFLKFINKKDDSLRSFCKVVDATEHAVDFCGEHDAERTLLQVKLQHWGRISELLSTPFKREARAVASFLVTMEGERRKIAKRE